MMTNHSNLSAYEVIRVGSQKEAIEFKQQGLRYNAGKPEMSLISFLSMIGLARVLTFGKKKYAAWNWAKGLPTNQTIDSLLRHLAALQRGELVDEESGLPHVDHIQCNAMFLSHFYHEGRWEELSKDLVPPKNCTI